MQNEAEAAIEFAVNHCTSHADRFAFLLAYRTSNERTLLNWPAWLAKREQLRAKRAAPPRLNVNGGVGAINFERRA